MILTFQFDKTYSKLCQNPNLYYQNADLTAIQSFKGIFKVSKQELTWAISVPTRQKKTKTKGNHWKQRAPPLNPCQRNENLPVQYPLVTASLRADSQPLLRGSSCRASPCGRGSGARSSSGLPYRPPTPLGSLPEPRSWTRGIKPPLLWKTKSHLEKCWI